MMEENMHKFVQGVSTLPNIDSPSRIKIPILISLLFLTLIFSLLPFFVFYLCNRGSSPRALYYHRFFKRYVISLMNCFTAGVFLGICFMDLLPEVEENIEEFISLNHLNYSDFPVAQFCVCLGFLLMLTFEQVIVSCNKTEHLHESGTFEDSMASVSQENLARRYQDYGSLRRNVIEDAASPEVQTEEDFIVLTERPTDPQAHSSTRYFMLALALSLHSIFEGLALGLETKVEGVVQLFAALAIHKSLVAFSLGINMVQSDLPMWVRVGSLLVFCFASPIGMSVGIGVEKVHVNRATLSGIIGGLQGLACGTFLFIVFFEILPHEFFTRRKRPNPLAKVLMLVLGLTLMSVVMVIHNV